MANPAKRGADVMRAKKALRFPRNRLNGSGFYSLEIL
jgi:hypothetical protein